MIKRINNHVKSCGPSYKTILFAIPIVLIWRGFWGLIDLYIFPENQTLSYLLGILIGIICIIIFRIPNVSTVEEIIVEKESTTNVRKYQL